MPVEATELRAMVHRRVLDRASRGTEVDESLIDAVAAEAMPLMESAPRTELVRQVMADVFGMGSIDDYLHDDGVTDVMVVGGRGVWIERDGQLLDTGLALSDDEISRLIERVVAPLGQRVDRASPIVDARLADGSRVNAVLSPLSVDGPCLTLRRFGARKLALSELAEPAVAEVLSSAVNARMNLLVTGATGSGKTTLLNALSQLLGEGQRIITIEDTAELRLDHRHVVRLEARNANTEGTGAVSIQELLRASLRMRPDRIIVGEIRGPEALDMLQAMNTGHVGSMSTCHANSCFDALARVETMVLSANSGLPLSAVRQQIASSIDLVVEVSRSADGSGRRRVVDVSEVTTHADRLGVVQLCDQYKVLRRPKRRGRL